MVSATLYDSVDTLRSPTMKSTVSHRRGLSNTSKITLRIKSPRQIDDLEKIHEEIQMKEQRMIKRYERFIADASKVEEDVKKRNVE